VKKSINSAINNAVFGSTHAVIAETVKYFYGTSISELTIGSPGSQEWAGMIKDN
jgi:hypothetical protein